MLVLLVVCAHMLPTHTRKTMHTHPPRVATMLPTHTRKDVHTHPPALQQRRAVAVLAAACGVHPVDAAHRCLAISEMHAGAPTHVHAHANTGTKTHAHAQWQSQLIIIIMLQATRISALMKACSKDSPTLGCSSKGQGGQCCCRCGCRSPPVRRGPHERQTARAAHMRPGRRLIMIGTVPT